MSSDFALAWFGGSVYRWTRDLQLICGNVCDEQVPGEAGRRGAAASGCYASCDGCSASSSRWVRNGDSSSDAGAGCRVC